MVLFFVLPWIPSDSDESGVFYFLLFGLYLVGMFVVVICERFYILPRQHTRMQALVQKLSAGFLCKGWQLEYIVENEQSPMDIAAYFQITSIAENSKSSNDVPDYFVKEDKNKGDPIGTDNGGGCDEVWIGFIAINTPPFIVEAASSSIPESSTEFQWKWNSTVLISFFGKQWQPLCKIQIEGSKAERQAVISGCEWPCSLRP